MINPRTEADLRRVDDIRDQINTAPDGRLALLAALEVARNLVLLRSELANLTDGETEPDAEERG